MGDSYNTYDKQNLNENEKLANAYAEINKVTNYESIQCDAKPSHDSLKYTDALNNLDKKYVGTLDQYGDKYVAYNMSLAQKSFLNTDYTPDAATRQRVYAEEDKTESDLTLVTKQSTEDDTYSLINLYKTSAAKAGKIWNTQNSSKKVTYQYTSEDLLEKESGLIDIQQQLYGTKLDMESDIDKLRDCITQVNVKIDKINEGNLKLKKQISALTGVAAGGEGKLYDAQLQYNQVYLGNWIIGVILIYMLYKTVGFDNASEGLKDKFSEYISEPVSHMSKIIHRPSSSSVSKIIKNTSTNINNARMLAPRAR